MYTHTTGITVPGTTLAATGAMMNTLALVVAGFALVFAGLAVLKLVPRRG
jgi:hypothetical protein